MKIFLWIVFLCCTVLIAFQVISCSLNSSKVVKKDKVFATFILGEVTLFRGNLPPKIISPKEPLLNGDRIETKDNSHIALQVRNDIVILISPKTKITLSSIEDIKNKDLELHQGEALYKLGKLSNDQNFRVKTSSIIVGVHNAQFLTKHDNNKSSVSVGNGAVSVIHLENNRFNIVDKRKSIDLSPRPSIRIVNTDETLKLNLINHLPIFENIEKISEDKMKTIQEEISDSILDTFNKIKELSNLEKVDEIDDIQNQDLFINEENEDTKNK